MLLSVVRQPWSLIGVLNIYHGQGMALLSHYVLSYVIVESKEVLINSYSLSGHDACYRLPCCSRDCLDMFWAFIFGAEYSTTLSLSERSSTVRPDTREDDACLGTLAHLVFNFSQVAILHDDLFRRYGYSSVRCKLRVHQLEGCAVAIEWSQPRLYGDTSGLWTIAYSCCQVLLPALKPSQLKLDQANLQFFRVLWASYWVSVREFAIRFA